MSSSLMLSLITLKNNYEEKNKTTITPRAAAHGSDAGAHDLLLIQRRQSRDAYNFVVRQGAVSIRQNVGQRISAYLDK